MEDPLQALTFALAKYPERVELMPMQDLVIESARQNAKRPAYVKLALPDDLVKSLRGGTQNPRDDQDMVLVVRLPREVAERAASLIVLPGEVR